MGKRWHLAIRNPCHAAVCKGVKKRKSKFDLRDNQDRGIAQDKTLVLILPSSSGFHSPSAIVSRHLTLQTISLVDRLVKLLIEKMVKSGTQRELGFHHRALYPHV